MKKITRLAPAKINLMLHVVEQLKDGYHHVQSLVAFASTNDLLMIQAAEATHLSIDGPFADQVPLGPDNLVIKAAQWLAQKYPDPFSSSTKINIHLTKNLPVASGIGGGSSDAAATIVALLEYHDMSLAPSDQDALILASGALGADLPMCLAHQFGRGPLLWIDGSGRESLPMPITQSLPGFLVLVSPGIPVSTSAIFKEVQPPYSPLQSFSKMLEVVNQGSLLPYLQCQQNDLTSYAIAQVPKIEEIIQILSDSPGCSLAHMSGTGATCFGLFTDESAAHAARDYIRTHMPEAWVG